MKRRVSLTEEEVATIVIEHLKKSGVVVEHIGGGLEWSFTNDDDTEMDSPMMFHIDTNGVIKKPEEKEPDRPQK